MEMENNDMTSGKKFSFFESYYGAGKALPKEDRGEFYTAIIEYAMEQIEPNLNNIMSKAMFNLIKPYLDKSRKNSENGSKGGRPKGKTETESETKSEQITEVKSEDKTETKTDSESQIESNISLKEKEKKNKKIEEDLEDIAKKKEKKESTVLADSEVDGIVRQYLSDEEVIARFMDYVENRKAMGKRYAMRTQRAVTLNLGVIQNKPKAEALEILNNAILRNWTGLYADKKSNSTSTKSNAMGETVSNEEAVAWTN